MSINIIVIVILDILVVLFSFTTASIATTLRDLILTGNPSRRLGRAEQLFRKLSRLFFIFSIVRSEISQTLLKNQNHIFRR